MKREIDIERLIKPKVIQPRWIRGSVFIRPRKIKVIAPEKLKLMPMKEFLIKPPKEKSIIEEFEKLLREIERV